jgi:shikimate kinase
MYMPSTRLYLIGFTGSGKSSIGKKLANLLGFDFFDTDVEIEKMTGKSIVEIFETEGETFFRKKERDVITKLSQKENIVISTGGGTPCFFDNMQRMNQTGLTVYLHATPTMLKQRILRQKAQKPLLKNVPDEQLTDYIAQLLQRRETVYRQSQIVVEAFNLTAKKLLWIMQQKYPTVTFSPPSPS